MPSTPPSLTRAARRRAATEKVSYIAARDTEVAIQSRIAETGETYGDLAAALDELRAAMANRDTARDAVDAMADRNVARHDRTG